MLRNPYSPSQGRSASNVNHHQRTMIASNAPEKNTKSFVHNPGSGPSHPALPPPKCSKSTTIHVVLTDLLRSDEVVWTGGCGGLCGDQGSGRRRCGSAGRRCGGPGEQRAPPPGSSTTCNPLGSGAVGLIGCGDDVVWAETWIGFCNEKRHVSVRSRLSQS